MNILRRVLYKGRKFYDDDFDWNNYTADSYARRLKGDIEAHYETAIDVAATKVDRVAGHVDFQSVQVHPNVQLIMNTVARLAPTSVHEVGCGGGDHIANVKRLFPDIIATGGDRSENQLRFALERHPDLAKGFGVQDITMPFSQLWPRAELVYSQAVVMHIHTAVSHFVALTNMVRMAQKYVLLVENLQAHNFVSDLRALYEGGQLDWETMNIYAVDGREGARAILLSREALDLPVIHSDAEIRAGQKASARRLKRADQDSATGTFGFAAAKAAPPR